MVENYAKLIKTMQNNETIIKTGNDEITITPAPVQPAPIVITLEQLNTENDADNVAIASLKESRKPIDDEITMRQAQIAERQAKIDAATAANIGDPIIIK